MFLKYLWKRKWGCLLFLVLAVISSVFAAELNLAVPSMFDSAQKGKFTAVILRMGLLFFGLIASRLLEHYANLAGIHVTNLVRKDIKTDLFSAVIKRQLPDFADRNAGEYIAEFTNDITIIETKFLVPLRELVTYVVTIVTVSVSIYTIDYRMTLVIIAGVILCLGLPILTTKYTSGKMIRFLVRFDQFVQHLKDLFGAFFTFKNYAVETSVADKFANENDEVEKMKYDAELALVVMNNIIGRLSWSIEIVVVVLGLLGVINGDIQIGSVFAAYLLAGSLGSPLQGLGNRISMLRSVKSIEQKLEALGMLKERVQENRDVEADGIDFDVTLDNVSLNLQGKQVLDGVSFTFEHGKKYLILGNNGSGKSTTVKLLKNHYSSYSGSVKIGDFDLRSSEGAGLSRYISYSNETVSLLSDNVKNNVLLYRNVPVERFENALKSADLNVSIDRMVGDSGKYLSSGERRKLEIARALIADPKMLIFDEVVSTLDIETAYEIEKLVLSFDDRTVIMVSNAFSGQLLEKYDQIIMMSDGKILAHGTHKEMLEKSSEYRNAYQIRCAGC